MYSKWKTTKTIAYTGAYDYGRDYDRRACGGVVHIQEATTRAGVVRRRAVTTNGRYSFVTPLDLKGDSRA